MVDASVSLDSVEYVIDRVMREPEFSHETHLEDCLKLERQQVQLAPLGRPLGQLWRVVGVVVAGPLERPDKLRDLIIRAANDLGADIRALCQDVSNPLIQGPVVATGESRSQPLAPFFG